MQPRGRLSTEIPNPEEAIEPTLTNVLKILKKKKSGNTKKKRVEQAPKQPDETIVAERDKALIESVAKGHNVEEDGPFKRTPKDG